MKKRGKILYSILLLLIAIGLIPLAISDWKLIEINKGWLETKEKEMQWNITSSIAQMISLYLEGQKEDIRNIALSLRDNFRTPGGGLSSISTRTQQNLLTGYLERHPDIRKIILLDNEGKGSQMGYSFPAEPLNDYLTEAYNRCAQGEEYLSNTYFVGTPELQESVVIFSTPIKPEKGENILGVISTIISLSPIQDFIRERARYGHTVYCIDGAGHLIAHSDFGKLLSREDFTKIDLVKESLKTDLRVSTTKSFTLQTQEGPIKMLGTCTPILNLKWAVFVQREEKKAYWSVHQMIRQTALWGALTFCIAIFLGLFFARGINSPIQKLAQGAKALSQGDFSHRITVTSKNELADLADTFNSMTNKIRLYISQIEHAAKENKELFISSIKMLAAAIDEKDPYTRGHSERVTHYSVAIAKNLNFSAQEIETVQIAGLLHDVGKIGIDDEVLRKPGKLTDEEYEIIKQHPRKGAYIMAPVKQLKNAIPGMLYHHEFMNGSGYPEGLKGSEIPMIARIIAVADCFDAITSDRPYQKAFEPDKAIKRLFDLIDSRYDPKVVAALVEAYERAEIIVGPPKKKLRDLESEADLEIKKEV
jgi:HD-GYP domain-containing protein (c-di-GMP phosphodiesterase class II)